MFSQKSLLGLLCESQIPVPVTPAQDHGLPSGFQLLPSELPNDLKQPIAGMASQLLHMNERLIDQVREQFKYLSLFDPVPRAHGLGCLQGATTCEDTQPIKEGSLLLGEQVITPLDRRLQASLVRQSRLVEALEEPESVGQPGRDLLHREHFHPRSCQLDSEWHSIQANADLSDGACVLRCHLELGLDGLRPLEKERHAGIRCGQLVNIQSSQVGSG